MNSTSTIKRLSIIGVGLIGGSVARVMKRAGVCQEIIGCGRNETNLQKAVELGVIDAYETDIAQAVRGADVVLVCVPLGAIAHVFQEMCGQLADDAVITDVGSAKASVIDAAQALGDHLTNFVPGHPIAGTERSGVEASFAELFEGRCVILTPLAATSRDAVAKVSALWEAAGARIVEMSAEHHDEVLAATSHLPHLLAYSLVDTLARMDKSEEIFRYAAGGFRDFTRIAASDPVMWRDICLANRDAILAVLDKYTTELGQLTEAIRDEDGEAIKAIFDHAKDIRDRFDT